MISLGKGPVNDCSRGILSKYVDCDLKFICSAMISLGKGPVNDYSSDILSKYQNILIVIQSFLVVTRHFARYKTGE
jgi:hypothetical protein